MRRSLHDDDGAVAVIVAIFLVVLIAMTAVVIDGGYVYAVRRQLQAAADAAALAGCQEVILGSSNDTVLAVARKYAEGDGSLPFNAVKPADGVVMSMTPPETEVTADHVKVTVSKQVAFFFAVGSKTIHAEAIAKVAYLTGVRGLVPWAVPIVQANRVTASLGGGAEVDLVKDASTGVWSGSIPVSTASIGTRDVAVTTYNGQTAYPDGTPNGYPDGVPETLAQAGAVTVEATNGPVQAVRLSQSYATAGVDSSVMLYVDATSTPQVRFNGKNSNMSPVGGNTYSLSLTVPNVTQVYQSFPIDVTVGKGNNAVTLASAAVLVVRRSTYPVSNVTISPLLFRQGATGAQVNVTVELVQYTYGTKYALKVIGGGAEVGNFCAVDLATTRQTPNWRCPQDPAKFDVTTDPGYAPPAYYHYLQYRFPFPINLGDTIWTQPGGLSGPQTQNALTARFAGDSMTFAEWSLTKPKSSRVVYVPVVEKEQPTAGQTPVRVVAFAAFYIDPSTDAKGNDIEGYFIQFIAPADSITDDPPPGFAIKTVHLVSTDY